MMSRTNVQREGTVVVAVAVSLVAILSFVALALDGGLLVDKRRQTQAAADAAALAAASELFLTVFTNGGLDNGPVTPNPSAPKAGVIAQLARQVAADNGFVDGQNGVSVQVFIPPQSGLFKGQRGHAEVIITTSQPRFFSKVFGSTADIPLGARAVARGTRTSVNNGIIVLDPTTKGSFSNGGTGSATIQGNVSVIVDSNDPAAMIANGGGTVTAPKYDVTGMPGYATPGGGTFAGTINSNVPPTPDPLRFIPQPDPTTMTVQSTKKLQLTGANTVTLDPGVYIGGVSASGKGSVVLNPGIYYMQSGGFSFSGQGSLTGLGVMIYNDPLSNSDTINLSGQGAITMTPPMVGPYQGISLFQRRSGLPQPDLSITGSGTAPLAMSGTFYAADALLKVTGNGTQDTIGSQYISRFLNLGGNGTFNVNWTPNLTPGVRQIWLVE